MSDTTLFNIQNFYILSFFLYYLYYCDKSCMTLLMIYKMKQLFKYINVFENILKEEKEQEKEVVKNNDLDEKKPVVPVKFEDKYLDKLLLMEEKELTPEKLDSLANVFVMENTSQGNVIMYWDNKRETFAYYADHMIPYRFLEVIGRKYVITNDCKKIFIDMEKEINNAKEKIENKKLKEETAEREKKEKEDKKNDKKNEDKKDGIQEMSEMPEKRNVFAKMKSYNTNTSVKTAAVLLDTKKAANMPKNTSVTTKQNEDVILKENANRYSYQGKLANFSFLKKVDRKVVDKNYAITFAEFKKLKVQNKT